MKTIAVGKPYTDQEFKADMSSLMNEEGASEKDKQKMKKYEWKRASVLFKDV